MVVYTEWRFRRKVGDKQLHQEKQVFVKKWVGSVLLAYRKTTCGHPSTSNKKTATLRSQIRSHDPLLEVVHPFDVICVTITRV